MMESQKDGQSIYIIYVRVKYWGLEIWEQSDDESTEGRGGRVEDEGSKEREREGQRLKADGGIRAWSGREEERMW